MNTHGAIGGVLLLSVCASVTAQEPVPSQVVVTGSRLAGTAGEAVAQITVLERADIERLAPGSGVDLLRQVPGLQIDQMGGAGGLSSVYLRGSDPNHVLVLIDGVRVNNPTNSRGGGVDFSSLDPAEVERIEVLYGAAAAVYGAEAMAGVIQIFTRPAPSAGWRAEARLGAGGDHWRQAGMRLGQGNPAASWSLLATQSKDGSDASGGGLDLRQFSTRFNWRPDQDLQFQFSWRHCEKDSRAFPDDSGGLRLAVFRELEDKHNKSDQFAATGRGVLGALRWSLAAARYRNDERSDSPGVAPGIRSFIGYPANRGTTAFQRDNVTLETAWQPASRLDVLLGAEWLREQGKSNSTYRLFGAAIPTDFDLARTSASLFGELKYTPRPGLTLRAGARGDKIEDSGTHWSPMLALRWQPGLEGIAVLAHAASGFRPPSFYSLGLSPVLGGNPDLKPERSKTASLGVERAAPDRGWQWRLAGFLTNYQDLVTFDGATNRLVNAQAVHTRGVESTLQWNPNTALRLDAHVTWLKSEDAITGQALRQRPGRRAGVQVSWTPARKASLHWQLEYAHRLPDSSIPTGDLILPTVLRHDLSFRYVPSPHWTVTLALDNVANRENAWYAGFPGQGRRMRFAADWRF